MLLVQAGASGVRPRPEPAPTAGPACAQTFHVTFVADVAGLRSSVDAAGWRGVGEAFSERSCSHADLALPGRPSEYRPVLQAATRSDLVIAGSFLLTDAVGDIARANPQTHFVLVDPIVVPPGLPNLAILTFRADQAAFLAGALAAMVTRTGVVAGVYGPQGVMDVTNRAGFEHGARYARPSVRVVGAYQPAGSAAYADPAWGAAQARAFSGQDADVIFGAGGTTGQGALLGATQSRVACINADVAASTEPECVLATSVSFIDRGVELTLAETIAGRWRSGVRTVGLAERAVGLALGNDPRLTPEVRARLATIADLLAAGMIPG